MILNVGPDAKGNIPTESIRILEEIGDWMGKNSDSIYGCKSSDLEKMDISRYTTKGKYVYVHVTEQPIGPVIIKGIAKEDIKCARLLSSGAELQIVDTWSTSNYPDYTFIALGPVGHFTYALPDEKDTVIKIELK